MSGTATASMQGILDRTRESSRPFVYPLNMHAQLSVKIGDTYASKDQCKALTGALGIMANTPFRFSKNTGSERPRRGRNLASGLVKLQDSQGRNGLVPERGVHRVQWLPRHAHHSRPAPERPGAGP